MTNHALFAARAAPYHRSSSRAPIAGNKSGFSVIEGQSAIWAADTGDRNNDDPSAVYSVNGAITGPLASAEFSGGALAVTASSGIGGSPVACSVPCRLQTQFGTSDFTVSGTVEPLAAAVATVVGQWEFSSGGAATVGSNPATISGAADFTLDPLVTGGGPHAMGLYLGPYALIPHDPAYATTAFGVAIYGQLQSVPASGNRQIVNKDATGVVFPGWTIEQWNVGGVSKLNGYMRDDAGSVTNGRFAATGTGVVDLPLNKGFIVGMTFDPTTTPKCRLYLRLEGGSMAEVGHIDNNGATTVATNVQDIRVGVYASLANSLDGAVERLILWAGAPTLTQLQALPAPKTILIIPPAVSPPIADAFTMTFASNEDTNTVKSVNVAAGHSENASATVSFPSAETVSNGTAAINGQVINVTRSNQSAGSGSVFYRLTNPDGQVANGTITVTITAFSAGSFTPFAFITTASPARNDNGQFTVGGGAIDLRNRPPYNAQAPRSKSWIDPMSGLEVFPVIGNLGEVVRLRGTVDSGLVYPGAGPLPDNSASQYDCWNADDTLLLLPESKSRSTDPTGKTLCRTLLISVTGNHMGATGPWQIIRASSSNFFGESGTTATFWDPLDPLRAYSMRSDGMYEYFPAGDASRGKAVGALTKLWSWPTGYSGWESPRGVGHPSRDGLIKLVGARRNDGIYGGFRFVLATGAHGPFVPNPQSINDDDDRMVQPNCAMGTHGNFQWQDLGTASGRNDRNYQCFNMNTGAKTCEIDLGPGHNDKLDVDGVEYMGGSTGGNPWYLWRLSDGSRRQMFDSGHSGGYHFSANAFKDTYEINGATGGSTSGIRYVMATYYGSGRGIFAIRTGATDSGKVRFICDPRGQQNSDNQAELHAHPSNTFKYVAFNSNWMGPGVETVTANIRTYVVVTPDAWKARNNNGLNDTPG